jgi:hypothetical protein
MQQNTLCFEAFNNGDSSDESPQTHKHNFMKKIIREKREFLFFH